METDLILWAIIGTTSGVLFGLIPGAGAFIAVAMLYPWLTDISSINVMMYYVTVLIASQYTNSVTAILYGIPGDATAMVTARNGHRLFLKGFGHLAVTSNAISSTIGVIFATTVFILLLPTIIEVFRFYNSVLQTLIIAAVIVMITFFTKQNKLITLSFFVLGGLLAKVGVDNVTFEQFLVFDNSYLAIGVPFASVMVGLYIVPELLRLKSFKVEVPKRINTFTVGKDTTTPTFIGCFVGFWCGLVPGVTNILGSYASANIVKRFFKKPVLKSIAAAEAANNSGALSSLLPLLILAIPITGSEVLIYYIMLENGFTFNATTTKNKLEDILYIIPFVTVFCLWLSWYGFNLLGKIAYLYKKYRSIANFILLSTISTVSILIFPKHEWMLFCILTLSVIGFILKRWETSPVIYGYFLSDLFYENLIRTLIIL
tara:strand:- start:2035 stop:3324 length:1290 start_codon:yes stop_codon:yes gene_type:complete